MGFQTNFSFDLVKKLDFDLDPEIPVKEDPYPEFPSNWDPEIIFSDPTPYLCG